jgi:hypothetical protein
MTFRFTMLSGHHPEADEHRRGAEQRRSKGEQRSEHNDPPSDHSDASAQLRATTVERSE